MTTTTTMGEPNPLARLLWFASPTFPTGGFAYSHGLEWAVDSGEVRDEAGLLAWLETILRDGAGRNDAILLRHAHRAAVNPAQLAHLTELAAAMALGQERQLETLSQGAAFAAAASIWEEAPEAAYPVAFGAVSARQGVAENAACTGFLAAMLANFVSAGIRLVPLGQSAGLRVLRALEPALSQVTEDTAAATLDDLGSACFRADIAALCHETQYSRMFRS